MKAIIDRIEGHVAVLVLTDNPGLVFNLPVSMIPDYQEGDIVDIAITREKVPESTRDHPVFDRKSEPQDDEGGIPGIPKRSNDFSESADNFNG